MKIENNINSINFGQKLSTKQLLKIGSGMYKYDDAKDFCLHIDNKFPGHVGYFKKAENLAKQIQSKNPFLKEIFAAITAKADKKEKLNEIIKQTKLLGEELDVVV